MPAETNQPHTDYPLVRRIRIHRKRSSLRTLKRFCVRFVILLLIAGALVDLLHPRSLHPPDLSSPLILPPTLPPSKLHLTPFVSLRTAIQWTPVETLSLHHLPPISADKPALFAASPVSRTFYPWEGTAFIASVKHGTALSPRINLTQHQAIHIPRFSSFSIHTGGTEATFVEYADGLSAAAALHAACFAAITTGDPSLPIYAMQSELHNFMNFLKSAETGWPRIFSAGWDTWPWGVGALRRFADRKRNARAAVRADSSSNVTAD